jgi:hypothetical protein
MTTVPCDCPGCASGEDGCWWPRGEWSPGLLGGVVLPDDVVARVEAAVVVEEGAVTDPASVLDTDRSAL